MAFTDDIYMCTPRREVLETTCIMEKGCGIHSAEGQYKEV